MLLSSLESVPGHEILRQLDVVYGSTVRSKHVGRDLMAGLKNIVGGELTGYTELLEESPSGSHTTHDRQGTRFRCQCDCGDSLFHIEYYPKRRVRTFCIWYGCRGSACGA